MLPDPQVPPSPMAPAGPGHRPVHRADVRRRGDRADPPGDRDRDHAAAQPRRARQADRVSLDVLSGGRFTLGIGVGYLEPEFRAIGANFPDRGAVTDEFVEAMQALWYQERPEYHGAHVDFAGVDAHPRPVQQPIPIVVGGHTAAAYRRAVARGDGLVRVRDDAGVGGGVARRAAQGGRRGRPPGRARRPRDHDHATRPR